jgi:hypothetical protein
VRSGIAGATLLAVGDCQLGLERLVLLAQPLVLGAHRLKPLTQRRLAGPLARRDPAGCCGCAVAQLLDPDAQLGLGVEPLTRDPGAPGNGLEADRGALGVQLAQCPLGLLDVRW